MLNNPTVDTAQSLGRLEGGMDAIKEALRSLTANIERDREDAHRHRSAAEAKLAHVETVIASLRSDMDTVKPLAEKWRRWQYVGFGALLTVGAIGSVIGSALTYFKAQIVAAFQ